MAVHYTGLINKVFWVSLFMIPRFIFKKIKQTNSD